MSSIDKPQLSQKWWDAHRPPDLKSNPLSKVLPRLETSLAEQRKKNDDPDAVDECLEALEEVAEATDKTIQKCDKTKHKKLLADLEEFADLLEEQTSQFKQLQNQLAEDDGDDESDDDEENPATRGKLFDKDYLGKMLKRLRNGGKEFNFGFGLNNGAPESSRLLLDRKGKPEKLFKALKRTGEFSDRQLTYGVAQADPQDSKTLVFRLESGAGEPPQILKLGRKFLCSDKSLKFRRLKVVLPDGKAVAETEPGPGRQRNA